MNPRGDTYRTCHIIVDGKIMWSSRGDGTLYHKGTKIGQDILEGGPEEIKNILLDVKREMCFSEWCAVCQKIQTNTRVNIFICDECNNSPRIN